MLSRISEFLWIRVPFILAHIELESLLVILHLSHHCVVGVWGSNSVALVSWHSSWENCIQGLFWRNHTWGASFIPGSDLYDEILDSEVTLAKDENF